MVTLRTSTNPLRAQSRYFHCISSKFIQFFWQWVVDIVLGRLKLSGNFEKIVSSPDLIWIE
jgi:hypothetical protein